VAEIATTLTDRGQVSMPASIRRELGLRPGQTLLWKRLSADEARVKVPGRGGNKPSVRGLMKKFVSDGPRTTAGWMKILREGDKA
jgi:AbrB family looped-hinge helix DNA binding protein